MFSWRNKKNIYRIHILSRPMHRLVIKCGFQLMNYISHYNIIGYLSNVLDVRVFDEVNKAFYMEKNISSSENAGDSYHIMKAVELLNEFPVKTNNNNPHLHKKIQQKNRNS